MKGTDSLRLTKQPLPDLNCNVEKMDPFSDLPEEVLLHILSFLTTKEAALTSVLAKRWHNLVAYVPCLTIDDTEFLHPEEGKQDREEIKQSFMDFVDRVLTLQGNYSPLKKFSLECVAVADTDRVDGWISNVLARSVSDFYLRIIIDSSYQVDFYQLPPKCFECSTLVKLEINSMIDVVGVAAGRVFLPLLKTLILDSVGLFPDEFETLLHALPSLEELLLVRVNWKHVEGVTVSSASIKTLSIKLGCCLDTLSFDTPSLLHFKYSGHVARDYPVVNLGNLLDAQIHLSVIEFHLEKLREPEDYWFGGYQGSLEFSNVWKLFHGIRSVPNLDLSADALEVIFRCYESMPGFNNLTSLTIRSEEDRGWKAMPVLLRNCPHLETLVINGLVHHVTDECGDVCDCNSREDEGLSLTLCPVKVMEIHGFQGTAREIVMIHHFLEYLPSLNKMDVVYAEEIDPTQLREHEFVLEIFELYNESSRYNLRLWRSIG